MRCTHRWDCHEKLLSYLSGIVTPVRNQASCGSCAAFSANAVHETCLARVGTPTNGLDLSEQQVLDCAYGTEGANGCNGAAPHAYQDWVAKNGGTFNLEADYPYKSAVTANSCDNSKAKYQAGAKVTKAVIDYECTEDKLKALVATYGAVTTGIYASDTSFGNYASGVFDACSYVFL